MARTVVTPERFATGMTFDEYAATPAAPRTSRREAFGGYFPDGGSRGAPRPDNSAVLRDRYLRARLADHQVAAIRWLVAQPGGPAKILVISEDWSSDCRRDVPMLARLAEAGGMELRIFNRDGKRILGTRRPDPAAAPGRQPRPHGRVHEPEGRCGVGIAAGRGVLHARPAGALRYHEYPAVYHKDLIRAQQQAARPGETSEQAKERSAREFAALQASPFFDLWASAGVDQILSALHERLVVDRSP